MRIDAVLALTQASMADWLLLWAFDSASFAGITARPLLLVRFPHVCMRLYVLKMLHQGNAEQMSGLYGLREV